jgi:thiamine biosynthesis lipoprotein
MSRLPNEFRPEMGRREFVGLGLGAFVVAAIPLARRQPPGITRRAMPVMGTIAQFAVVHRDPRLAHAAIDAAFAELQWVERTMSRFTDGSDVGRANRSAHRDGVLVSPDTALVTAAALRWSEALDGRYDPFIGAVSALWDVKNRHEPPPDEQVRELAGRRMYRAVEVGHLRGASLIRYHERGPRLDLGSIAKGYGVDRAVQALRDRGITKALVVAGGDLYALGTAPDDEPWSIGIQSPLDEREIVGSLQLSDRAVATSGTYRQFFRHRGRRYHHIMDPATAAPRSTSMQSLTIEADDVMQADAATTALFGMPDAGIVDVLRRELPAARLARILRPRG